MIRILNRKKKWWGKNVLPVALGHELIEGDDDEARHEELEDDKNGVTRADGGDGAVHARKHVHDGLTQRSFDPGQTRETREGGKKVNCARRFGLSKKKEGPRR